MTNFEKLFRTTDEQVTPIEASLSSGSVPEWIDGKLVRVCPAVFDLNSGFTVNHFFDGYSVLYKFEIRKGKVKFSKKFLKSDAYEKAQKNGRPAYTEYGTRAYTERNEASIGFLARAITNLIPDMTDNCNANIFRIGNSYFTVKGSWYLRIVEPEDLSTGIKVDLHPRFGVYLIARHVLRDHNGDSYIIASEQINKHNSDIVKYNIFRVPSNTNTNLDVFKGTTLICSLEPTFKNFFLSSFGMSDNYIILIESPLVCNRAGLRKAVVKGAIMSQSFIWMAHQMDRFYVVDKTTGALQLTVYESKEPFFFFHIINCYEDNEQVIVDVIGYDSADILSHLDIRHLRKGLFDPVHLPQARRYIIPLIDNIEDIDEGENILKRNHECKAIKHGNKIQLSYEVLYGAPHEHPSINKKHLYKKYRYYYATGHLFAGENEFSVIKVDIETGIVKKWFAGEGQIPCGPIFVENPNSVLEDDGVLVVAITSTLPGEMDRLVILDATDLELIGSASVNCHVPFSRGGIFIDS